MRLIRRLTPLALVAVLLFSLVACDSSQPSGYRVSRRTGTQSLVYFVQPTPQASIDAAFQRAANMLSWSPRVEARYVRSCPAARTCVYVRLGNASPNLAYFQILDGSGLAAGQYHTAQIVVEWPWPPYQNLNFVACHEVFHFSLRHGDHYQGNGMDGPCEYNSAQPTDLDMRNLEAIYGHPNDAVGSPGV